MRLAVSTASFGRAFREQKLTLLDFPEVCARAGLEAIELNDFCLNADWTIIRELRQRSRKAGLDICAVAVESNFYRASPAEIERERRHIEEYVGIASYLGAPLLRVNTCPYNRQLPATIIPKGVTEEMAFAAAVQTFRSLMPLAEEHRITFVLENHGGISRTSADQIKIARAVDSKWFRINLDTGNYHADPMAGTDPFEDFLEATPKVAPYLAFCHAKIWDVTDDLREPTLNYDRFFALLRKLNYQGPISIEFMGKKDVMEMLPKCVALLKRCRAGEHPSVQVDGAQPAPAEKPLDKYGGFTEIAGHSGESFHLERIGSRWWLVTPEGHGTFIRAVSKVDVADYGGSGGFRAYDAVYLQTADGAMSSNLATAAENTLPGDVVHPAAGVTLHKKGDALYLGSSRFRPNFTYFWLERLGQGGTLQWYYSTADGWKRIEPSGQPCKVEAPGPQGAWNLDTGDYMAPDENGFGKWKNPRANRVTWWDMARGFPADFSAAALPGDPVRRHYVKGVVERDFATPPVLNQTYERADLEEEIARKYGPGDFSANWAAAITQRLKSWGFNAAGQYSYRYAVTAPQLAERLPVEPTWALGGWATGKARPYRVKNVYAGAVFPPGSGNLAYQGLQPDVFDPQCETAYRALVAEQTTAKDAWSWALIPEEADYLFGLNSLTHDHLGYVVLGQNPYQPRASRDGAEITYDDPRLYAKYALRDFLRSRYRAIEKLNAAWGARYTTWDTSAGDLLKGDNAWGTGTGLMDENGRNVLATGARSVGFDKSFTDPAHPAIRKDLDDFLGLFAARYGAILEKAFAGVAHPVLLLPIYHGPESVYRALAPYVDGFWVNVPRAEDALRIYHAGRKPLLVADYLTATPDSALHFRARIASLRYDATTGRTIVTAPDLRYVFRLAQFVGFPDCRELLEKGTCGGKHVYPFPRIASVRWNTVEVPGDFTGGVTPGMYLEKHGNPDARRTQENRARAMGERYRALADLRGDDGVSFVIGVEHWCLYDPAVSNWVDSENFGLATFQDNAYDGAEARRATGADVRGRPVGGEDADYGNLLGEVGKCLRDIDDRTGGR